MRLLSEETLTVVEAANDQIENFYFIISVGGRIYSINIWL